MLVIDGLSREGDALLLAASIAGGASLVVEQHSEAVRFALRNGVVDSTVLTLDEALSVLRKQQELQQPVVVLLEQEATAGLVALIERGAQPDLLRCTEEVPEAHVLWQRGAVRIPHPPEKLQADTIHIAWRAADGGSVVLRQVDLLATQLLPDDDHERQNWMARAPRYLHRSMRSERCVAMSEVEAAAFLAALEERAAQKALNGLVHVEVGGQLRTFGAATA